MSGAGSARLTRRTALGLLAASLPLGLSGCVLQGEATTGPVNGPDTLSIDYATYNPLSLVIKEKGWLEAALAEEGVEVEVVDLRSLSPLDTGLVESSVRRTGRLVVAHEASRTGGLGAELVATVAERAFHWLEAPPVRVTGMDVPYPPSKLEHLHLPDLDRILDGLDRALGRPNSLDSVDAFAVPETAEQFLAAQNAGEETR